jgi:hypothetical protein
MDLLLLLETKTGSESDIVDPSTPLVAIAIASVSREATDSTALDDEGIHHQKGSSGAPTQQYRLYKRRWWA